MEEIVLTSDTHALTLRNKGDSLAYECPDCFSEITISDKDKELALAFGDIIIDTCPECAVILTIKMN